MNIYCCYLHKVNKLVEIENEPREVHPNVNIGKQYTVPEFFIFEILDLNTELVVS